MNTYNLNNMRIDPSVYLHPLDKKASDAIKDHAAFQKALQFISKNTIEKQINVMYRSTFVQLTPKTAPALYRMVDEACEMFGVDIKPVLFLQRMYSASMTLRGIDQPMIMISTELLRQTEDRMTWGLIAPVIAGIRSGYSEIRSVEWLCSETGLLPNTIVQPLKILFQNYRKYVQFTFDRGNLIATGDLNTSMCGILAGELPMRILKPSTLRIWIAII